jgi:hypothetical protein
MTNEELIQEGLRRAAEEGDKQRKAEKEHNDKIKAERKKEKFEAEKERAETARRNAADTYRTQTSQQAFDFGTPTPKGSSKGGGAGGAGGFEDTMKKGVTNKMPSMKAGGKVSSASSRGDGCAQRGKTRGTMVMCSGGMAKGKK